MATHSSILAWKIPWTEEPGRLQSMGLQRDTTERLHFSSGLCLCSTRNWPAGGRREQERISCLVSKFFKQIKTHKNWRYIMLKRYLLESIVSKTQLWCFWKSWAAGCLSRLFESGSLMAELVKNLTAVQETACNEGNCLLYRRPEFDPWVRTFPWRRNRLPTPIFLGYPLQYWASLVAQTVKNPSAMQETWVRSLSWEDPLEEGMATHTGIFAWRIPMDRGAWQATVHGVAKSWIQLSD